MSKENRVSDERLAEMIAAMENHGAAKLATIYTADYLAAITELQSLRSKPVAGVEVKPLEWSKLYTDGNGYSATDAKCVIGLYSAYRLSGDTAWVLEFGNRRVGDFDQLAQAQEVAQTDYSKCLLSTLLLPAQEPAFWHNGMGQMLSGEALAMQDAEVASRFCYPLYASRIAGGCNAD